MPASAPPPSLPALQERAVLLSARLSELQQEQSSLSATSAAAAALGARADAVSEALSAQTRELRQRVRRAHAQRLSASEAEAAHMRSVIMSAVSEEIARPNELLQGGAASRVARALLHADELLSSDPHACLRGCMSRTYEAWGALCLHTVRVLGLLEREGAEGDSRDQRASSSVGA